MTFRGVNYLDYATLAVTGTAKSLADATPAISAMSRVHQAVISFESNQCRWRADGTPPTNSEGHLMDVNDTLQFVGANYQSILKKIQFIAAAGTCNIKISYLD